MISRVLILLMALPCAFALGADVPLFTAPSQSGLTFAHTPNSQSTFSQPHYTTPPAQETAEQAANRLIRDGAYTRDLGQSNQLNLEQAQKEMDQRKADLAQKLETNREARNQAEQGLGGDAPSLIKEHGDLLKDQQDMADRQKSMDELKGRAAQQMVAGQDMENSGNTLKSTLSQSDGCKGQCGGGGGGGSGGGGSGGGGGGGKSGMIGLAVGAVALGAMLGIMAASGSKDDKDSGIDKYLDEQHKKSEEENRIALEEQADKAATLAAARADDERVRAIKAQNDQLSNLFLALSKDSKDSQAAKTASPPVYTPPRTAVTATVAAIDLRIVRCFHLPGGIVVPCQPGTAQLCVNQAGQSLPCP